MRDLDVVPRYCLENGLPFHTFIEMCKNVFFYLISSLMQMRASQKRSSSALGSDSVGSIIRAPATGQDLYPE